MQKESSFDEWFAQALYDLDTAEALFRAERFVHAVFMAHLSVEKALKGAYLFRNESHPPKTHDLIHLVEISGLNLPEEHWKLIYGLKGAHLLTRYPVELEPAITQYNSTVVRSILDHSERFTQWIKQQL